MSRRQGDDLAAPAPVPHSRWLVRENVNLLAASHAKAAQAIAALQAAADLHHERGRGIRRVRPPLRQRMTMRRDWPQVIWFCVLLLAVTLLLSWVSVRLIARLVPAPVYVAVLPGVLLAAAAGGAARFAAHSIRRRDLRPAEILSSLSPLVAASAAVAAWVSLWLVLTSGTPVWTAVVFGLCLALAVAVGLMTGSYLGGPPADDIAPTAASGSVARRTPRRLQARHGRARKLLDDHTRQWMTAAHRYAVIISGTGHPEQILVSLLAGNTKLLPLDGLDPFHAMILCGLRDYHPASLAADLRIASAKLMIEVSNSIESS